jgi:hypothetical protein
LTTGDDHHISVPRPKPTSMGLGYED